MVFSVLNGFHSEGPVEIIVEAETRDQTLSLAAGALRRQNERERDAANENRWGAEFVLDPVFWTPTERWTCEPIELPYVTGG